MSPAARRRARPTLIEQDTSYFDPYLMGDSPDMGRPFLVLLRRLEVLEDQRNVAPQFRQPSKVGSIVHVAPARYHFLQMNVGFGKQLQVFGVARSDPNHGLYAIGGGRQSRRCRRQEHSS